MKKFAAISLVFVVCVGFVWLLEKHQRDEAAGMLMGLMPAWAVQGPFSSGAESGQALEAALVRVAHKDKLERLLSFVPGHVETFDQNPEGWEEIRELIFEGSSKDDAKLFLAGREVLSERLWQTTDNREIQSIFRKYRVIDQLLVDRDLPFGWSQAEKELEEQVNGN